MPNFSVVIPTKNRETMLCRALDSVLSQKFDSFEIIVANDGADIAVQLPERVGVCVTVCKNRGNSSAGNARNAGLELARGEWIVFLDDDDELAPNFLQAMYETIQDHTRARFAWSGVRFMRDSLGNMTYTDRNFSLSGLNWQEVCLEALSIGTGFGLTIHKSCFGAVGKFDSALQVTEDVDLLFRLLIAGFEPAAVAQSLVHVHDHSGERLTNQRWDRVRIEECRLLMERYAHFIAKFPPIGDQLVRQIKVLEARAD